jgi:hypothetical protein
VAAAGAKLFYTRRDAPGVEKTLLPVPDWAVKVVQATVRDYRYTGDYVPSQREEALLGLRRGDRRLGLLAIRHWMNGPRHLLRIQFDSLDEKTTEGFTVSSLKQIQEYAPLLLERVCKYGCSLEPRWCEDCSQAGRHANGQFRGLTRPSESPGEAPATGASGPPPPPST